MIALAFQAALLTLLLASFVLGGRPERLAACAYAAAAVATELLRSAEAGRYQRLQLGVMWVDLLLLAALLSISLLNDLRWPICATTLQFVTVLGHVAKLLKPAIWPLAYAWMMQASSFPSLLVLAIGIATSRRRRASPSTLP